MQLLLMRQPGAIIHPRRHTGLGVYFLRIVRDIGIGEESPDREGEAAIVHRRVFGIRLQPLARVAKMFAKDKSFRLRLLRRWVCRRYAAGYSAPPPSPSICTTSRRQPSMLRFSQWRTILSSPA